MKKMDGSKKVLATGAVIGALLTSGVGYASGLISWGGEENVARIESVLDGLNSEILKRDSKIKNSSTEVENMKFEISEKESIIKEKDSEKLLLENTISELEGIIETNYAESLQRESEYVNEMDRMEEENNANIDGLMTQIKEAQFNKDVLQVAIDKLTAEKNELEGRYQDAVSDSLAADDELAKARQDVEDLRIKAEEILESAQLAE